MTAIRVLGISGSFRAASYNTTLLNAAVKLVGEGMRLDLWRDLKLVPPFSEDDESEPPRPVTALRLAIAEADALLIATPEYNGSIPGQLKNAVDGAQAELRKVLGRAGARVRDRGLVVGRAHEAFDPGEQLRDPVLRRGLVDLIDDLQAALHPVRESA